MHNRRNFVARTPDIRAVVRGKYTQLECEPSKKAGSITFAPELRPSICADILVLHADS